MSSFRLNAFVLFADTVFLPSMLTALPLIVTIKSTWLQRVFTDASIPILLGAPALMLLVRTLLHRGLRSTDRAPRRRAARAHHRSAAATPARRAARSDRLGALGAAQRRPPHEKGGGKLSFNAAPLTGAGERHAFFQALRGRLDR
jgi:hypothetical protein